MSFEPVDGSELAVIEGKLLDVEDGEEDAEEEDDADED